MVNQSIKKHIGRLVSILVLVFLLLPISWAASPLIPDEPVLPIQPYLPTFTLSSAKPKQAEILNKKAQVWVLLLVNTYQQRFQAYIVATKLQKSGFPAYVQKFEPVELLSNISQPILEPVYRVLVGPDIDKSRLQAMQRKLQAQYQFRSRLQQFTLGAVQ